MKRTLYVISLILFFYFSPAQKRCNMVEISLDQRLQNSELVVEGIVKNEYCKWDDQHYRIYTIYEVEVLGVLKGRPSDSTILIACPGGTIGLKKHIISQTLELYPGATGVFMLVPNNDSVRDKQTVYEPYAMAQGFVGYDRSTQTARGVFEVYKSIADLYGAIEKNTKSKLERKKAISWQSVANRTIPADSPGGNQEQAVQATITSFSPTTIQAGRNVQLTITGTGFGASQGTSYVAFKNADDGGSTYIQPNATHYISWSDTQIVVEVPSQAGTGTIRVYTGTSTFVTSSSTLTVEYAITGFDFTYNSVLKEYRANVVSDNGSGGYTFSMYTGFNSNTSAKTDFKNLVAQWSCNTGINWLVSSTTTTTNVAADDGVNVVRFESTTSELPAGTLALATSYYDGCAISGVVYWALTEVDVTVDSSTSYFYGSSGSPTSTQYDFYTIVLHEMGHAHQLSHLINSTKLMHYSLGAQTQIRTISSTELAGAAYEIAQSSATCTSSAHTTLGCNPSVTLTAGATSISESAGSTTITATLSTAVSSDVVVNLSISGTATSGSDYTALATSITIPGGSLTGSLTLTAIEDSVYEGSTAETVIINISSVTNGTESGTQVRTVSITDNEAAPTVTLSTDNTSFTEGASTRTVTATLSTASSVSTTVTLAYSGTATYGTDYTVSGTGTTITIAANATSGSLTITNTDDSLYEGTETIIIDISAVTNATENGTQQKTISLFDNESAPTVTLSGTATIAEASGTATITATLSAISGLATTVTLTISGTAESTDYVQAISIVVPAGSLSASISCTAVQDSIDEANETVISDITGVTNGTESGTQKVTITITDDDASPSITLQSTSGSMPETGGTFTLSATSTAVSEQDIVIVYTLSGTATENVDYNRNGNYILIPAGQTTSDTNVVLTAVSDAINEGNETIIFDVSTVSNGTETGSQQAIITIIDDDVPTVTLTQSFTSFGETGSTNTYTATLSIASSTAVIVNLGFSGTATINADYSVTGTSITIPAGSLTGTVTLTAIDDLNYELDETIIVDITSVTNATENGIQQLTLTILSFDPKPSVTLSSSSSTMAETSGSSVITATLNGTSYEAVTITLAFTGTATLTSDYTRTGTSITIPAGSLTGTITLNSVSDLLDETDETVIVDVDTVTNGFENGTQQKTVTITDDDATPTVTIAWTNTSIGEGPAGTSNAVATLSAVSGQDVTVNLSWVGNATLNLDYTVTGSVITIPAGSLTGFVTMNNLTDTLDEGSSENIGVSITSAVNATAGNPSVAFMTQNDDDSPPTVSLTSSTAIINENAGTATLTANLSTASGLAVTVNFVFSGTASFNSDYSISSASVVIPAGSTSGTVTITALNDASIESNETIIADIFAVANGTESGTQQKTITIADDDNQLGVVLKLFIEGYYSTSSHSMVPVNANQGIGTSTTDVNAVTVELRNSETPYALVATTTAMLQTNGTVSATFNATASGTYYVVVKHTNAVETWSALPLSISQSTPTYDFTTSDSKAYGSNMKQVETGVWAFFCGDINQDGNVDTIDYPILEGDMNDFANGYYVTDLNGDGNVDTIDYPLLEQNMNNFVSALTP